MKKRKTGKDRAIYAFGTSDSGTKPDDGMGKYGDIIKQIPGIADGIIGLLEDNPNAYSDQPIMNASTIRGMATPYALGGLVDDGPTPRSSRKTLRKMKNNIVPNNYGIYNGIIGQNGEYVDNPTELEATNTMLDYLKNNIPESNVYRPEFQHTIMPENAPKLVSPKPVLDINPLPEAFSRVGKPIIAAYGGEIGDEDQLQNLQAMADEQGISIEELLMQLQDAQNPDSMDDGLGGEEIVGDEDPEPEYEEEDEDGIGETFGGEFAYGGSVGDPRRAVSDATRNIIPTDGIRRKITPADRLKTMAAKQAGLFPFMDGLNGATTESLMDILPIREAGNVLANPNVKKFLKSTVESGANMLPFSDQIMKTLTNTFALGGTANKVPIEVEGDEVLESPTGTVKKAVGPSHADGGIDLNVAPGTKIFSDRVKVDGQTMAERKIKREKAEKRIEKLKLKHEYDPLVENSLQRTMQVNKAEEAEDMQLQEVLKSMDTPTKFDGGGRVPERGLPPYTGYYGPMGAPGDADEVADWTNNLMGLNTGIEDPTYAVTPPLRRGYLPGIEPIKIAQPPLMTKIGAPKLNDGVHSPLIPATPDVETEDGSPYTTGDYVGMAGNLFNAVAPFVNTRNAARATSPTINRYRGFGREAIEGNDAAQTMATTMGSEALTDIDTSANTAIERGRSSAGSIGTARAMDVATTLGANKAKVAARDATTRQLIGLVGQRGQLTNVKDKMEMSGQERADMDNQAKTDNYFSNNAANLVNFGSNITGLGRNLNTSVSNRTDANLIASMAKNSIKVDTGKGKIVNKYMEPAQVERLLSLGYTIENGKLVRPKKRA